jgi:hypothetical protein
MRFGRVIFGVTPSSASLGRCEPIQSYRRGAARVLLARGRIQIGSDRPRVEVRCGEGKESLGEEQMNVEREAV